MRIINLTGKRFGTLVVLRRDGRVFGSHVAWLCRCDCGNEKRVASQGLRTGNNASCGCVMRAWRKSGNMNRSHGLSKIPEYKVWKVMRQRCSLVTCKAYPFYGGRGIRVCDRWRKFENFIADMGRRPGPDYSIERIDNDGNYEPGNCKWATRSEQMKNRRPFRGKRR